MEMANQVLHPTDFMPGFARHDSCFRRNRLWVSLDVRQRNIMEHDPYIRELWERVAQMPSDHSLRLRLAIALFERSRFNEALPEIQRARQDASLREQAMDIQSQIFKALGQE